MRDFLGRLEIINKFCMRKSLFEQETFPQFFWTILWLRGSCIKQQKLSEKWDVSWYTDSDFVIVLDYVKCWISITILYHTIENTVANKIRETHDGKIGCKIASNIQLAAFLWYQM